IPTPPILCPRFVGSLTVATQDSRPSGSLLLSRETLSFSASCRFIPAHCNRDVSPTTPLLFKHDGATSKRSKRVILVTSSCEDSRRRALLDKRSPLPQWWRRTFVPQGAQVSRSASAC